MKINRFHSWNPEIKEAFQIQKELRRRLVLHDESDDIRVIAACDVSVVENKAFAAACLFSYPELDLLEESVSEAKPEFPYVPGLLSFRECPVLLSSIEKIKTAPDLFIFGGQGIAHPRRMGLAAHMGIILGRPSIGCAKSKLCGDYIEAGPLKGDSSSLLDARENITGAALRTRANVKPVFVSQGHMISLERALEVVLRCTGKHRVPEPLRTVHNLAKRKARGY